MAKPSAEAIANDVILDPGKWLWDVDTTQFKFDILNSCFPTLDNDYLLFKKNVGELGIVAGRPGAGKTAFMGQAALHMSKSQPVMIFTLEMSHSAVAMRLMSAELEVPISYLQKGYVKADKLEAVKHKLKAYKLLLNDRPGLTIFDICSAIKIAVAAYGIAIVYIDYLQYFTHEPGHSRSAEISKSLKMLKALARELSLTIVVGSQFNRDGDKRALAATGGDSRPVMSDLAESGSIEQDADWILAIHPVWQNSKLNRPNQSDFIILKNRSGKRGEFSVGWNGEQTMFVDSYKEE